MFSLKLFVFVFVFFLFICLGWFFFKARIQAPGPEHRLKTCVSPSSIDSWSNRLDWIANSRGKVNLKVAFRELWGVWGAGGLPGKHEITGYSPMKHCKGYPGNLVSVSGGPLRIAAGAPALPETVIRVDRF